MRALIRYDKADAARLAAALTYYAFFATFAMALLGFAILSRLLDYPAALAEVQRYLSDTFPRLDVQALRNAGGTAAWAWWPGSGCCPPCRSPSPSPPSGC
ncbi:hypothetical protein [Nonomuraea aurantiaca]|uniref:hypothetical protein n=1 Tax=Nonomuraea aurantiaca TaxID=2878562 RepID=UPI001CD95C20|nr:hypothetical protein [Nonomuraea aurantiaca]MCA2222957.1 hypothetical protein [Nonomuraea aurantiaca]